MNDPRECPKCGVLMEIKTYLRAGDPRVRATFVQDDGERYGGGRWDLELSQCPACKNVELAIEE